MRHIVSLFLIVFFAACSGPAPPGEIDDLRVALVGDLRGTNPGVERDSNTDDVLHQVVEGLVGLNGDLEVAPMLAESWDITNENRVYTFHLRPDVRFHNGALLTAGIVKWNFERYLDPDTHFDCLPLYDGSVEQKVESVEAPDVDTVVIRLEKPSAILLESLAYLQCPVAIIHPDSIDGSGNWQKPIGTGPYSFVERKSGREVVLERFPEYSARSDPPSGLVGRKQALANRVRWIVVDDPAAAMAAVQSGQIDLVYSVTPVIARDLGRIPDLKLHRSQGLGRRALLVQTAAPPLDDIRVRRAIAHAIDYELFARTVSLGEEKPNPSVIPGASPFHSSAHDEGHAFDAELSRRLLKEAGYDGEPVVLQTTRTFSDFYDSAQILESMLRNAGFNVQIKALDWATLLSNYYEDAFQLMTFAYTPRTDPAFAYATMLGDTAATPDLEWGNVEAASLLLESTHVPQADARQELYDRIHALMLRDVPTINLGNPVVIDVMQQRVTGYSAWPVATPRLWVTGPQ